MRAPEVDPSALPRLSVLMASRTESHRHPDHLDRLRHQLVAISHELIVVDDGSTAALNRAYRHARGRLIMIIDGAVRLDPGAVAAMIDFLADHPTAAGVSPHLREPGRHDDLDGLHFSVPYASVSCLLLHRSAIWATVGAGPLFDEGLPRGWSGTQLLVALDEAGLTCWTTTTATAVAAQDAATLVIEGARS